MNVSFPHMIERNARMLRDKTAIICEGRETSWQGLCQGCCALASGLQRLGIKPSDRVAFVGLNSDWFYMSYFAPSFIGAETVALNWRLSPSELADCMDDSGASLLIADSENAEAARQARALAATDFDLVLIGAKVKGGERTFDSLLADPQPLCHPPGQGDDTLIIFYSGGTTGRPKGIMLSHWNMFANSTGHTQAYDVRAEEMHLLIGPMFHLAAGARIFCAVLVGYTLVIHPKFTPRGFLEGVEKHRINATSFVPAMLQMVLDEPDFDDFDLSSLRQMSYGASATLDELLHRIIEAFPHVDLSNGYGMTEAAPLISTLGPEYHRKDFAKYGKLGAVGWPVPHVEIRVVDEEGNEVPRGTVGEIVLRGPNVMKGYVGQPELTAETLRGGWLHSGDAGYQDEDGCLWISGRVKDMIISGGENVYPAEVENLLSRHPGVADVAVIGIPHDKWGEAVHAIVIRAEGANPSVEGLIAFCREKIAGYKCPQSISWRTEPMPLTAANKVLKTELRKPFWEEVNEAVMPPDGTDGDHQR
ncbi:class I adenylate-forming enzyme family protein [Tropicibacter sp. Alg240-R139]|uniref:class I adenylate-forming enzyme family protein n=1 Tax=Tropicibacter sp. Alg240-R139 TaxID=2305991 RepID=UPI0013DFC4C7|nr:long-chain fatty acid--CoA ligase [Tropicibacter sp. Alg240-R139]